MQDSEKYSSAQSAKVTDASIDDEEIAGERYDVPALVPRNGMRYVISAGVLGGFLAALLPVVITYLYAPTYREAVRLGDKMPLQTAYLLFWAGIICYVAELVIAFVVGIIVGRLAVRRILGFYAGLLVSAISYIGSVAVHYIPGYPDTIGGSGSGSAVLAAIGFLLLVLAFRSLIGGLLGLWGTWLASRRHPYYAR